MPQLSVTEAGKISGFTATCVLISSMVGTGIFTTTGFMARDVGDAWLILLLWGGGAILALTGALCYSELGAAFPYVGGDYVYLRETYHPFVAFMNGWASFTVGFGAAIAAGAMGFASYVLQLLPDEAVPLLPMKGLALALVWLLTLVHLGGVGLGGMVQQVLTVLKLGAILLLLAAAVIIGSGNGLPVFHRSAASGPGSGAMIVSFIFVTYAYSGWNAAGYIAGEMRHPVRTIPRTMIGGTLLVGVVYVSLNLVYLSAVPLTELAAPPLMPVAEKTAVAMFGPAAASVVTLMLCISLAGTVSAMIWTGPRVYFSMARDGFLPAPFAAVGKRGGAPGRSILLQSLWVTALVLSGSFEQLVIYSGWILTLFTALTVASVIFLRHQRPHLHRPFRLPLHPLLPCCYIVVAVVILVVLSVERPTETFWACLTLIAGLPLYLLRKKYHFSREA